MAKEWAKAFYNSSRWYKCRRSYISKVFGLCERCGQPGKMVHHVIWLTKENINNPEISLNHDLLELLCHDCHNAEHIGRKAVRVDVMFDENGDLISKPKGEQIFKNRYRK